MKGLHAVLAANPWLIVAASIAAAVIAIKRIDKAIDDNRAKIITHGKEVASQHKEAQDLYKDFLDVDSAYKNGTANKENLITATDKLLQSLGLERWQIQGLTDDYEKLNAKMKDLMLGTLASDQYDLLDSVNSAYKAYSKESRKTSADYSFRSGELVLGSDKATSRLIQEMIERGIASADIGGNLRKNIMGQWVIDLGFDNSTIENSILQHRELVELKDNLSKIAADIGMADDFTKSGAWVQVNDMLDAASDSWKNLNDSVQSYNEGIAQYLFIENDIIPKTAEEYADLRKKLLSSDKYKGDEKDAEAAVDAILSLIPNASELAGTSGKRTSQSDSSAIISKTNKALDVFKKNIKSLRIDIVKALGEGKTLSEEQNAVFLKWRDSLGYTKEQLEEVYTLFQMMYKETPPSTITADTVGNRVRAAREEFEKEQALFAEAEKKYGYIDINQAQFGNIDMNNRQVLEWTEENLEKYKDALKSNRLNADELANTVSTVLGGWDDKFVDGEGTIPIAFSPMLQTESGKPELLTDEVIHKYINALIKKADEEAQKAGKDGWTNEMLFKLDAEGIEVDGKKIQGIIAAVGDEAEKVAEIMHFVGAGGSIQLAAQEFGIAYGDAVAFAHNYILDDIGNLLTLQDEIKKAGVAWEEYQKIISGGEAENIASNMTSALEKALEDLDVGKIDSSSVWGAAKLLFSDEKLANELRYDLNAIAQELNGDFIKYLFGKPENEDEIADYAARISNILMQNAGKWKSVDIIQDPNTRKFKFWYSSLKELADDMGLTETAVSSLFKALDAYDIQMIQSGEETRKFAEDYKNLVSIYHDQKLALDELLHGMAQQGVWEPHALEALQNLREAGIIEGDDSSFIEMIKEVYREVEEANRKEAHPEVFLDGVDEVRNQADALWSYLNETLTKEIVIKPVLDESGIKSTDHEATGTRNAPGGITLVNELGPELISDNGVAYIANGGKPGFVNLSKGAVVFNADETKGIFRNGYSNAPVHAYADGTGKTVNKSSIRERLIHGGNVRGAYTGGVSKVFTCGNCGHQWNYSPIDYPNGPTGYCPKCGAQIVNGQTIGGNTVDSSHANDDYYAYDVSSGNYIDNYNDIYDDYSYQIRNEYKSCPNCGSRFGVEYEICPYCGYNFHTGRVPSTDYEGQKTPFSLAAYSDLKPGAPNRKTGTDKSGNASGNTGGRSGYTGNGGGSNVGYADYAEQSEPEKVDWISVILNRIQRKIADIEKIASSGFKSLETRLKAGNKEITEINTEIGLQKQAYDRYLQEANNVWLSDDLVQKVQDGTIDISEYDDETRELIDKYETWYEKALDAKYAVEELTQEISDLYLDMFNNTQTDFENQLALISHTSNMVQKNIQEASARGYMDSAEYYKQLSLIEKQNIYKMYEELGELQQKFDEAMDSGTIEEESEAWYSMLQNINGVEESIKDANIRLIEYSKTMRSIDWSYFDYMMTEFSQLQQEANFLIGVMANDKLIDDMGSYTDKGVATMGLRVMNYNAYMTQADEYAQEMQKIEREMANGPYDTELIERRRTLLGLQQQMIQAAESEKDAMKDLVSQGIQAQLGALKDLIDEYEKSLDSAHDLYTYQKKISQQTGAVAKIQKQLLAYRGDNSEENRARVQKLEENLREAQEELEETEYEKNIAERKKLLSELYDEYESYLNKRLDNLEALVREIVGRVNGSSDAIREELQRSSEQVGYTITDGMQGILETGVYGYYDKVFSVVSYISDDMGALKDSINGLASGISSGLANNALSITGYLDSIKHQIDDMNKKSDETAAESFEAVTGISEIGNATPGNYSMKAGGISFDIQVMDNGKAKFVAKNPYPYGSAPAGWDSSIRESWMTVDLNEIRSNRNALAKLLLSLTYRMNGNAKKQDYMNAILPFSTGGLADYTGLAMLHGSKEKPELVLNQGDTERFLEAAKLMRTPMLEALASRPFDFSAIGAGQTAEGLTIENFNADFNFEHVNDYDDLLRQMQRDSKFEKLIHAVTDGQYTGKRSKFSKYNIKF